MTVQRVCCNLCAGVPRVEKHSPLSKPNIHTYTQLHMHTAICIHTHIYAYTQRHILRRSHSIHRLCPHIQTAKCTSKHKFNLPRARPHRIRSCTHGLRTLMHPRGSLQRCPPPSCCLLVNLLPCTFLHSRSNQANSTDFGWHSNFRVTNARCLRSRMTSPSASGGSWQRSWEDAPCTRPSLATYDLMPLNPPIQTSTPPLTRVWHIRGAAV
jgi:hypothetical protein